MNPEPIDPDQSKAHQPDGTDSSEQWEAQIADENMIPDGDQAESSSE